LELEVGSGFQITELEDRKPGLKDCRKKSSQLYFWAEWKIPTMKSALCLAQCFNYLVEPIMLLVDGK